MKSCLVICPFGPADSEIRKRSDSIFENFIKPIAADEGYEAYRSIDRGLPGDIITPLIKDLYEADLVIADLTDLNPNVFYELAIRHAAEKPFIHIAEPTVKIPFDVGTQNVIWLEEERVIGLREAGKELKKQIQNMEDEKTSFETVAWRERVSRPETFKKLPVGAYTWPINYPPTLAKDWLRLQTVPVQQVIENWNTNRGWIPNDIRLRKAIAEFKKYREAQNQSATYELYYIVESGARFLKGWAISSDDRGISPSVIAIKGQEKPDGPLTIRFTQQPHLVNIVENYEVEPVEVEGFTFPIRFVPDDPNGSSLSGEIYHPHFDKLLVAMTQLGTRLY